MTFPKMVEVEKDVFDGFVNNYTGTLQRGVSTICEPPVVHYHDRDIPSKYKVGTCDYFLDTEVCRVRLNYYPSDPYVYFAREDYLEGDNT